MGSNRLGSASSAYLRSAAHQPVHWFPWGSEAFSRAASQDKPVLLDIGAVWCHWCHVMDGESYEDPELAAFLNEHFVCVKVDRDERPDVDARYQRGVQAIAQQGGWPLTGFLTPDAQLFFGGTYFPPRALQGRPSFRDVLSRVLEVWRGERPRVQAQAQALRELLAPHFDETVPGELDTLALDDATHRILATADRTYGGFGTQPKFPHPSTILFLLHRWCDTPEPTVRAVIHEALDGMARGGFRDLLGGGFHRYSVDARWIVPHFEKLSSDNAELLRAYGDASALFEHAGWRDVARDAVRWIREVVAQPDGGFAASQDADVGLSDDGDYFTWTREELAQLLAPAELELAAAHFGLGSDGRMPHAPERNVLFQAADAATLARRLGRAGAQLQAELNGVYEKLRAARATRKAPYVDLTRYGAWNALLAGTLLRVAPLLADPEAARLGLEALERLRAEQRERDTVAHTPGPDGIGGLLDDPVQAAAAALEAYEATGETHWLDWAVALMERVWAEHWDAERGGLRDLAGGPEGQGLLRASVKPIQDSPNASPNGIAGQTLARLFEHTQDARWRERHERLVTAFGASAARLGLFASAHLLAADWLARPATHAVITGPRESPLATALTERVRAAFLPRRVIVRLTPDTDPGRLPPALRALTPSAKQVRGYLCVGARCLAPVDTVEEWNSALRSVLPAAGG